MGSIVQHSFCLHDQFQQPHGTVETSCILLSIFRGVLVFLMYFFLVQSELFIHQVQPKGHPEYGEKAPDTSSLQRT